MLNNNSKYFKLFACCIPVRGYFRSIICDTQRGRIKLIPNDLYDLLKTYQGKTLDNIKKGYQNKYDETIDEYITFLVDNEFGFWCDNPELYPDINLDWDSPYKIMNVIIDVDLESNHPYEKIIKQLNNIGCHTLQIRYFCSMDFSQIENKVLKYIRGTRFKSVELLVSYNSQINNININEFLRRNLRINQLIIHSAPFFKEEEHRTAFVLYTDHKINSKIHCGVVEASYFVKNLELFSESQHYNSCLNRKISIDIKGNIKNCPSMSTSYGNICNDNISIKKIIKQPDFQQYWNINKDKIHVCKDCEFRYVCTDCRAYIEKPEDIYSKPLKCGYNPYTGEWSEWSTNPLKQKAIKHYCLDELILENEVE